MLSWTLVGTILLFSAYKVIPSITPWWLVFYAMMIAYGNGAVLGLGSTLSPRIGVTVCGAAFGFFFGFILDTVLVYHFVSPGLMATLITILSCVVVFALISIPLYDYMVILSSCSFGSYMAWRGLSMLVGGFPAEYLIALAMKSG
jgi:hypothetical protein